MVSMDTIAGSTPSSFAEAADQAVSMPTLAGFVTVGAMSAVWAQRWWEPTSGGDVLVPVFYVLAVAGGALCAFLLRVRARLTEDRRLQWVAVGFVAAAAVGLLHGVAVLGQRHGPVVVSPDAIAAMSLLWHAALPTYALLGLRHGRRGVPAAVTVAFVAALLLAVTVPGAGVQGWFVGDGAFTSAYRGALVGAGLLAVVALVAWVRDAGRDATRPQVWIAAALALSLLDLLLSLRAVRLFEAVWWSSTALSALRFTVPAVGLLADSARLSTLLRRHEQGLSAMLEQELSLATLAAEREPRGVGRRRSERDDTARVRIEHTLRSADFHLVFQPIYSLATGELVAAEALTRFSAEPARPPDRWFAEAHAVGLGWELEMAALQAALARSRDLPAEVAVTVNLSPGVLVDPRTTAELSRPHERGVVVEITEHAIVEDYPRLSEVLVELRGQGIRVAIDDAGAGFASLRHVVRLAPDIIKLDRTLTRDVHLDPVQRTLATCLAAFAQQTDTLLIAEGVEHPDELTTWQELGAHAAQGYLLGRPGPLPAAPLAPVRAVPGSRPSAGRVAGVATAPDAAHG
jgi:EAL domain-containing protein (putative c-di-GMP-specific phosphodiesterase class I)